eukprot:4409374-Amphidinium_carterae.1
MSMLTLALPVVVLGLIHTPIVGHKLRVTASHHPHGSQTVSQQMQFMMVSCAVDVCIPTFAYVRREGAEGWPRGQSWRSIRGSQAVPQ